jgi:type I restriction enzyme S subunit
MNNEMSSPSKLPKGWVWTNVSEVASLIRGVSYPKEESSKEAKDGYLPILRANNIDGELNFNDLVYVPHKRVNNEQLIKEFDLLIAMSSGSKDLVGKASQANRDFDGGFGAFCGLVRIIQEIDRRFVGFFFRSPSYRSEISRLSSGVNINNLRRDHIESMPIPLPPLSEQQRIVAKIEELFTRLDVGVEALKRTKTQLKRYRQAVLKHAFEGKLTAEWRQAHKHELEPASVLLERIKQERQRSANGKYRELPPLDTSNLPGLSDRWVWARFNQVCSKIQDGSHFSPKIQFDEPGKDRYLYITAKNIRNEGLDLSNVTYVDSNFYGSAASRCDPQINDVLLIKDGVKTGTLTVNNLREQFCILSSVAILRCHADSVNPHFISYYLKSPLGYTMISGAMTGTAIRRIILDKIRQSYLPIASKNEQDKIVVEIERRFSTADQIEKNVDRSLKQAERLRHSILRRAFEGKLVPQDPQDEPAAKLLERIKAEKTKHLAEAKAASKNKKRTHKNR